MRGLGAGAAATANWLTNAVVSHTFLPLIQAVGGLGCLLDLCSHLCMWDSVGLLAAAGDQRCEMQGSGLASCMRDTLVLCQGRLVTADILVETVDCRSVLLKQVLYVCRTELGGSARAVQALESAGHSRTNSIRSCVQGARFSMNLAPAAHATDQPDQCEISPPHRSACDPEMSGDRPSDDVLLRHCQSSQL